MPSKIYSNVETALLFADSAQSGLAAQLTLSALPTGAGRYSVRYDRGAASHAGLYEWLLNFSLTGTNIAGASVEIYVVRSDGTYADGALTTADTAVAAASSAKRNNTLFAGLAIVDQTTTNVVMTGRGYFWLPSRYFSMFVWNATTLNFQTSTTLHQLYVTPVPDEVQ